MVSFFWFVGVVAEEVHTLLAFEINDGEIVSLCNDR
jgi:hypothetical protein